MHACSLLSAPCWYLSCNCPCMSRPAMCHAAGCWAAADWMYILDFCISLSLWSYAKPWPEYYKQARGRGGPCYVSCGIHLQVNLCIWEVMSPKVFGSIFLPQSIMARLILRQRTSMGLVMRGISGNESKWEQVGRGGWKLLSIRTSNRQRIFKRRRVQRGQGFRV